jgi:cytidyltransferase-like protein
MKRVLVFGTFDPLHDGHRYFFTEAKHQGEHLIVVVAPDAAIRRQKHREPAQPESLRLQAVAALSSVNEALLGEETGGYELLRKLAFEVVAVGYDQKPSDADIRRLLVEAGKPEAALVRLPAWQPERYSSTRERLYERLRTIKDPELGFSIIDLGLVRDLTVSAAGEAVVLMTLTSAACPQQEHFRQAIAKALIGQASVRSVRCEFTLLPPWSLKEATAEVRATLALHGIPQAW